MLFEADPDLREMRKDFPQVFFDVFNRGFKHYLEGDWTQARKAFRQVETIKRKSDEPT